MRSLTLRYSLIPTFLFAGLCVYAQPNAGNQAMVTIVGDAPDGNVSNDPHDFIQSNPYNENYQAPQQQQMTQGNIEPTLENGFHMRYELQTGRQEEPMLLAGISTSRSTSSGGSSGGGASMGKSRRHGPSMDQRKFNIKKRLKAWLPQRKKRYRPHLCGRF